MIKICEYCETEFDARLDRIKFCSRQCYWSYRKRVAEKLPRGQFIKIAPGVYKKHFKSNAKGHNFKTYFYEEVNCSVCGKDIIRYRTNVRRQTNFVCSKECKKALVCNKEGSVKYKRGKGKGHILEYHPDHPQSKNGYIARHRLMVEQCLGRPLTLSELVHHIDFDPQNNEVSNFDVVTAKQHSSAQTSIFKLVKRLMAMGIVDYDKNKHIYIMREDKNI